MGKVAAVYNLLPQDSEVPLDEVAEKISGMIPGGVRIVKVETKPLAFGLKLLETTFLMDDVAGITDELEAALQKIEGVQSVEPVSVSLI